jgi:hypothetical protein
VVEALRRLRAGRVASVSPGFDGEYGHISLFEPEEAPQASLL